MLPHLSPCHADTANKSCSMTRLSQRTRWPGPLPATLCQRGSDVGEAKKRGVQLGRAGMVGDIGDGIARFALKLCRPGIVAALRLKPA
jgi:hypothetical protein